MGGTNAKVGQGRAIMAGLLKLAATATDGKMPQPLALESYLYLKKNGMEHITNGLSQI